MLIFLGIGTLRLQIDIIVMHAMIHMQIKTGMGRHIEYSEMHPQMHEESKKVSLV